MCKWVKSYKCFNTSDYFILLLLDLYDVRERRYPLYGLLKHPLVVCGCYAVLAGLHLHTVATTKKEAVWLHVEILSIKHYKQNQGQRAFNLLIWLASYALDGFIFSAH